jgi:hypothetical protein
MTDQGEQRPCRREPIATVVKLREQRIHGQKAICWQQLMPVLPAALPC